MEALDSGDPLPFEAVLDELIEPRSPADPAPAESIHFVTDNDPEQVS